MNKQLEQCKIGQGVDCCRYLVVGPKGFECMKMTVQGRDMINGRVENMVAKGDNCEGHTMIYLNQKQTTK